MKGKTKSKCMSLCFIYRYLVPRDMSVGQFIHILSLRLRLTPGKALFVFVKDTLPQTGKIKNSISLICIDSSLVSSILSALIYDLCLQLVLWILSTNLTKRMMDFCICVTAARKPLVVLLSTNQMFQL